MTDVARLAIQVDSRQVRESTQELDRLDAAGKRVALTTEQMTLKRKQQVAEDLRVIRLQGESFEKIKKEANNMLQIQEQNSASVQKLLARYDPLGAKLRSLRADVELLDRAFAGINRPDVDRAFKGLIDDIDKTEALMRKAGVAGEEGGDKIAKGMFASLFATQMARRELIMLGREAVSGQWQRIPSTLATLTTRAGVASGAIIGILAPLALLVGSVVAVGKASNDGAVEMRNMSNAIVMSGGYAGVTRGQMHELAEEIESLGTMTIGTSKKVVTDLVGSGRVGAEALAQVARLADDYAGATGKNAAEVGQELVKMFSEPGKAAEELNKQLNALSPAEIEHILHLERTGRLTEAQILLAEKLASVLPKHASQLGALERAWETVTKAASKAWDAMLGIGRPKTLEQQLTEAEQVLERMRKRQEGASGTGITTGLNETPGGAVTGRNFERAGIADTPAILQQEALVNGLREQVKQENDIADAKKVQAEQLKKQNEAQQLVRQSSTYQLKTLQDQLELLKNAPDSVDKTRREYEIRKEILELQRNMGAESRQLAELRIEGNLKAWQIEIQGRDQVNASMLKMGQISELQHARTKTALDLERNTVEQTAIQRQLALKGLTALEREKLNIQLAQLRAQRGNIEAEGQSNEQAIELENARKGYRALAESAELYTKALEAVDEMERERIIRFSVDAKNSQQTVDLIQLEVAALAQLGPHYGELTSRTLDYHVQKETLRRTRELDNQQAVEENRLNDLLKDDYAELERRLKTLREAYANRKAELPQQVRDELGTAARLNESKKLADSQFQIQADMWKQIDRVAHDTWVSIEDSAKGTWERIRDSLKNTVYSLLYQMTLRPFLIQAAVQVGGQELATNVFGAAAVNGAQGGGVGGAFNALSGANSAYNMFSGNSLLGKAANWLGLGASGAANTALGLSAAGGIAGGLGATGATGVTGLSLGASSGIGLTAGGSGVGLATGAVNSAAIGTGSIGAAGSVMGAISAAAPYVAAAVALASAFGLFGKSKPPTKDLSDFAAVFDTKGGIKEPFGKIQSGMAEPVVKSMQQSYAAAVRSLGGTQQETEFYLGINQRDGQLHRFRAAGGVTGRQEGSYFDSGVETEYSEQAVQDAAARAIFAAVRGSLDGTSKVVQDYFESLDVATLSRDQVQNTIAFGIALKNIVDAIGEEQAGTLVQNYSQFSQSGEALEQTVARVASEVDFVNTSLSNLGVNVNEVFGAVGVEALQMRSSFVELLGGLQNAQSMLDSYYQNFFSESERYARAIEIVDEAMHEAGVTVMPSTRAEFRRLVEAQDLTTEAGREMYAVLLGIAPAFAEITQEGEALSGEFESVATELRRMGVDVNAVFQDIGNAGAVMGSQLVRMLGGLQDAQKLLSGYRQNFYTPTERRSTASSEMQDLFNGLGLSMPQTREQFRQLVDAQNLSTASGRRMYAELIKLSPAFAEISEEIPDALDKLQESFGSFASSVTNTISDLASASSDQANMARRAAEEYREAGKDLLDFLADLRGSDLTILMPKEQLDESRARLQSTYAKAQSGDLASAQVLPEMVEDFLTRSREFNASSQAYIDDFNMAQSMLNSIATRVLGFANAKDRQAILLELQTSTLGSILEELQKPNPNQAVLLEHTDLLSTIGDLLNEMPTSIGEAVTQETVLQDIMRRNTAISEQTLTRITDYGQSQLGTLQGILEGVNKLPTLIEQFLSSLMQILQLLKPTEKPFDLTSAPREQWLTTPSGEQLFLSPAGAVGSRPSADTPLRDVVVEGNKSKFTVGEAQSFIASTLAAGSKDAVEKVYEAAKAEGVSLSTLNQIMGWAPGTAEGAADFLEKPRFATGGVTKPGMFVAGEEGPELIFSAASQRVLSAAQSEAAVVDGERVMSLLREVNERFREKEEPNTVVEQLLRRTDDSIRSQQRTSLKAVEPSVGRQQPEELRRNPEKEASEREVKRLLSEMKEALRESNARLAELSERTTSSSSEQTSKIVNALREFPREVGNTIAGATSARIRQ